MKAPQLFLHVRVSSEMPIEAYVSLRDRLIGLAAEYGEVYYVRVKRRQIGPRQTAQLMAAYERRARATADSESKKKRKP